MNSYQYKKTGYIEQAAAVECVFAARTKIRTFHGARERYIIGIVCALLRPPPRSYHQPLPKSAGRQYAGAPLCRLAPRRGDLWSHRSHHRVALQGAGFHQVPCSCRRLRHRMQSRPGSVLWRRLQELRPEPDASARARRAASAPVPGADPGSSGGRQSRYPGCLRQSHILRHFRNPGTGGNLRRATAAAPARRDPKRAVGGGGPPLAHTASPENPG